MMSSQAGDNDRTTEPVLLLLLLQSHLARQVSITASHIGCHCFLITEASAAAAAAADAASATAQQ